MVLNLQMKKTQLITNEISFKDLIITHICKPKLKNSYISITADAKIVLKTPKVSHLYIQNLLLEKSKGV